jgi:DNA-binding transcriptional ArsR family regulator
MSKGKSNTGAGSHLPVLVDLRLLKGLGHVLRQHILLAAMQAEISPKEMSEALGEDLSQISYHVKVLRDDCDGLIEETRTEQRRGAVEHYYRATEKTLLPAKAWRRAKKGARAVVGAGMASDLFNDLAEVLNAGKLQGADDHIVRTPLVLDAEGRRNVRTIAERATREAEEEQRAVARRMARAGNDSGANGYTFALFAFEAPWKPADIHAIAAGVGDAAGASADGAQGASQNGGETKRSRRKAGTAGN